METEEFDVCIENTGEDSVSVTIPVGVIEVGAGERKKVCKDNVTAEDEKKILDHGDLYPASYW